MRLVGEQMRERRGSEKWAKRTGGSVKSGSGEAGQWGCGAGSHGGVGRQGIGGVRLVSREVGQGSQLEGQKRAGQ